MPTQTERTAATTSRLLAAARRCFGEIGYAQTSTEDIVAAAQLTRGALYHHFGNKERLFAAVFDREEERLAAAVVEAASRCHDPADRIKAGCRAFLGECLAPEYRRIALVDAPAVLGHDRVREVGSSYTFHLLSRPLAKAAGLAEDDETVQARTTLLFGALCEAAYSLGRAARPAAALEAIAAEIDALVDALVAPRPSSGGPGAGPPGART